MNHAVKRFRYVVKRLLQALPIVLAIVVVNFFLLHMAEGDAVDVLAGEAGSATPEYMAELREKFGLDKPLIVQLGIYLKNVLSFDLGYSFRHEMPVSELVLDRFIPTLLLMVSTIILAVGVGILLGLLAATGLNTWRDNLISIFALGDLRHTALLGRADDDRGIRAQPRLVSNQRHGEHRGIS